MVVVRIYEKGSLYGTARIWNDQTGTKKYANYGVEMETVYSSKLTAKVIGFSKDPGSPWALLYLAINVAYLRLQELPKRNIECCKVLIELWPKGSESDARVLGIMEVTPAAPVEKGGYDFGIFMRTFHQSKTYERNARMTDSEVSNPWILVSKAIDTAIRGTKYLP